MIEKQLPGMVKMTEVAENLGVFFEDLNQEDLFLKLADYAEDEKVPKTWFKDVYIRRRVVNDAEKERRLRDRLALPVTCIWPLEYKENVIKILGKQPTAFYGFNYWNRSKTTHYVFKKPEKCWCGNRLDFKRHYFAGEGKLKFEKTESIDTMPCKKCGKKYILLKVK